MNGAFAAATPPAGGAAFHEILIAMALVGAVMAFFGWVVLMERLDRPTFVSRFADFCARVSRLPRWAALPSLMGILAVLLAGWGVWWDVPTHMQRGRDPGPLANPSHYPILLGILGFTHAGILAMGLAREPLPRHSFRLTKNWRVPMGSLIISGAGLMALTGFPADDLWHRLFGQDVTEWGPTHTMMIGGAVTFVLGIPVLMAEAAQVSTNRSDTHKVINRIVSGAALAACAIPFAFLMEFDLGVPQFPAATQFLIFAFVMAWIGITTRLYVGPGGALLVGVFYLVAHAGLWGSVWLLPDVLTARFLLGLPALVLIEILAMVWRPKQRDKIVGFALTSGLLVGSLGMYAEWWWSKYFMPLPQPFNAESLPFLLGVSTAAGLAGGLMSIWFITRVRLIGSSTPPEPGQKLPYRGVGLAGLALFLGLMAVYAPPMNGPDHKARVTFSDVTDGQTQCAGNDRCLARVTVRFIGKDPVPNAVWFYALAWQGNPAGTPKSANVPTDPAEHVPGIVRTAMVPTGTPGEYRTKDPVPLYGQWKTLLRLHVAPREMVAFPMYAPDDPAIKAAKGRQVSVTNGEVVQTSLERSFLQRERIDSVPASVYAIAYSLVIIGWIALLLFYGWCYNRAAGPVEAEAAKPLEKTSA